MQFHHEAMLLWRLGLKSAHSSNIYSVCVCVCVRMCVRWRERHTHTETQRDRDTDDTDTDTDRTDVAKANGCHVNIRRLSYIMNLSM